MKKLLAIITITLTLFSAASCMKTTGNEKALTQDNTSIVVSDEIRNKTSLTEAETADLALSQIENADKAEIVKLVKDGTIYTGTIINEDTEYSFDIDSATGKIVAWNTAPNVTADANLITEDEAKKTAVSQIKGATEKDLTWFRLDKESSEYEGAIVYDGKEYEFEVDAKTGKITEWDIETIKTEVEEENNNITIDEAKKIAIAQVKGATEKDIREIRYDKEDGKYEGKIVYDGKEYEFDISAKTGKIIEWDVEAINTGKDTTGYITIDEAKKIALAKVSGASANDVTKLKLDKEDGKYEGEIIYNGKEYDFDIDAKSGKIIEWETENVKTTDTSDYISLDEAKKIALAKVSGASSKNIKEIELDKEDRVYEGEIIFDGKEYDFEIDAKTGKVIEWDVEKAD